MPRIPTYRQRVLPTANPGAAPINPNAAYVNSGAIGEGVAGLGSSLFKLGQQFDEIKINEDVATGLAQYQQWMTDYELNGGRLEQDDKGNLVFPKEVHDKIKEIISTKHRKAQTVLNNRIALLNESNRAHFGSVMASEKKDLMEDQYKILLDSAMSSWGKNVVEKDGKPVDLTELAIDEHIEKSAPFIGPDRAEIWKLMKKQAIEKATKENHQEILSAAIQDNAFVTTSGEMDMDLLKQAVNGMTDDATERSELIRFALNEKRTMDAVALDNTEQAVEAFKKENYKLETSNDPELIRQEIENYQNTDLLTVDEKRRETTYLTNLLDYMARKKSAEEPPFDPLVYDEARTRIQEVRFDKSKYGEVRQYLLENVKGLGIKWDETRNYLDTAYNATKDQASPHVQNAVDSVNKFFDIYFDTIPAENIRDVIFQKQAIMDEIEIKAPAMTPVQAEEFTRMMLAPIQQEQAKTWWNEFWNPTTVSPVWGPSIWNISPPAKIAFVAIKDRRRRNQIVNTEPVSVEEFTRTVKRLSETDEDLSRKYYDRWKDKF